MKGKREKENEYSFWLDAYNMAIVVWFILILYIGFRWLSVESYKEAAHEIEQPTAEATEPASGRIPGDDVPAEGYASLSAIGLEVTDIYEHTDNFLVTNYCGCSKCCGKYSGGSQSEAYGALGTKLTPYYSIAVDPNLIPLGTILWDEEGNYYKAEDTGSGIKGNHIDLFVGNHKEAWNRGTSYIQLYW